MIEVRHEVIRRFHIDRGLQKHGISKLLEAAMAVIEVFIDRLKSLWSMRVWDRGPCQFNRNHSEILVNCRRLLYAISMA